MSSQFLYRLGAILIACGLSACAWIGPTGEFSDESNRASLAADGKPVPDVESLLIEIATLNAGSRTELRSALAQTEQRYQDWGDVGSRIKLAWLLSRPGTGFQDNRRSVSLLREYLDLGGTDPGYRALANLLQQSVLERDEGRYAVGELETDLREAREQNLVLEEQISTLQELLQTLQQQFEALKDIETDISERPTP
jgi:hypothetical protein